MTLNQLKLGCMGFSYKEWVGPFYTPGTPQAQMARAYSRTFETVELDTTFYAPPRPAAARKWADESPPGFTFAAKVWQRITHELRFIDCDAELAIFLGALEPLGEKTGPLLLQCPPDLTADALPDFARFAVALPTGFRWAVEFRHRSWLTEDVYRTLEDARIALVAADLYYMPRVVRRTADFLYVRLLGNRKQITDIGAVVRDRSRDVDAWAERLREAVPDVEAGWVYANNHYSGFSPHTVALLADGLSRGAPVFPKDFPAEQPALW